MFLRKRLSLSGRSETACESKKGDPFRLKEKGLIGGEVNYIKDPKTTKYCTHVEFIGFALL